MASITVQRQCWQRWPRVLVAEKHNDDGTVDERRYVPEGGGECEVKYHNVEAYGDADKWTCLSCGEEWLQDTDWPMACPWCGKAVER